jgi:hypothetical protein
MAKFTTLDEYKNLANDIAAHVGEQAVITTNLTDITEGVALLAAQLDTATKNAAQLAQEKEDLIKQNGALFLRLGSNIIPDNKNPQQPDIKEEKKISLESLVENGRIKK